jgi:hypothetical protein
MVIGYYYTITAIDIVDRVLFYSQSNLMMMETEKTKPIFLIVLEDLARLIFKELDPGLLIF